MFLFLKRLLVILMTGIVVSCSLALDTSVLNEGCPEGTKACFGKCVSIRLPEYGCGRAGCAPCALQHATSNCSDSNECSIAQCTPPFDSCDGIAATGCETNTDESAIHCGGCTTDCTLQAKQILTVQTALCGFRACYVYQCAAGYLDCDGIFLDGCEVTSDAKNCGACNNVCSTAQSCVNGICQ